MLVAAVAKRLRKNVGRILLHEDVALERQPGRHFLVSLVKSIFHSVVVGRSLHNVSMSVPRVAVCASERAPDVGIDGPESHSCNFRSIENVFRKGRVVADVLLLSDYWKEA